MEGKLKPPNITVTLGGTDAAQKRRAAYDKASAKEGLALNAWARKMLDRAAGFKE